MHTATKERAAPSPKSATSATNAGTLRWERRRRQGGERREDCRRWRPVRLGDLIEAAMAGIVVAKVKP